MFYHYTSERGLHGIRQFGLIKRGDSPFCSQQIFVSLTTSSDPEGHGLLDGRTVLRGDANFAKLAQQTDQLPGIDRILTGNMREFRLSIDIDKNDPALFHWDSIVARAKARDPVFDHIQKLSDEDINKLSIGLRLTALYPIGCAHLNDAELIKIYRDIEYGLLQTNEKTWWFFEGDIEVNRITKAEKMNNDSVYKAYSWNQIS
jgi:hypothetical protein